MPAEPKASVARLALFKRRLKSHVTLIYDGEMSIGGISRVAACHLTDVRIIMAMLNLRKTILCLTKSVRHLIFCSSKKSQPIFTISGMQLS